MSQPEPTTAMADQNMSGRHASGTPRRLTSDASGRDERHSRVGRLDSLPDIPRVAPLESVPAAPVAQEEIYGPNNMYPDAAGYPTSPFPSGAGHHPHSSPVVSYPSDPALEFHTRRSPRLIG